MYEVILKDGHLTQQGIAEQQNTTRELFNKRWGTICLYNDNPIQET